jgi:hypothetical protein
MHRSLAEKQSRADLNTHLLQGQLTEHCAAKTGFMLIVTFALGLPFLLIRISL